MKLYGVLIILFFILTQVNGQELSDTIQIKDMVYTGQVSAQKVKKSVYEVTIINEKQIKQSAAINLADLLNQTLNIQITPNASTGKSGLNLLGLNSQYVKVLVDNIPIINDEGLGNFTDFTQINLSDIKQIEIVEGAMSVDYGANAVSGIINIITKRSANKNIDIELYAQEETVGNEYNLSDKGRHIAGINIKKRLSENIDFGVNYNHNLFEGFFDDKNGKRYYKDDGLRGYAWLPKQQYDGKALINYHGRNFKLFYRANYFQENIQRYNSTVLLNESNQFDLSNPTAQDTEFSTTRWFHLLNASGNFWDNANYNISLSYQKQDRDANFYTYHILQDTKTNEDKFTYESRKTMYGKALFEKTVSPGKWQMQLGVETYNIEGKQSPLARSVDNSMETKERELGSYDFFMSSDLHVGDKVTVRPGIRALFSSRFDTSLAYSLSASYLFGNNWELRSVIGSSPKSPTYEQLFTYFVDSNHHIVGNENLKVERGNSVFLHLKKKFAFKNNAIWRPKLTLFYLHLKDQIELVVSNEQPLEYTYDNFETFTNRGLTWSNQLRFKQADIQLGLSYTGTSYESDDKDVLYGFQGNFLLNYSFPEIQLHLTSNFKYYGPQYSWVYDSETDDLIKGKLNAYTWWDVSLRKRIIKNLDFTVGVRNLTDIINVKTTATAAGAHSEGPRNKLLGYGRSYFMRLTYDIPFK